MDTFLPPIEQPRGLMDDKDAEKSQRVMQALLKMVKLDISGLKQAYNGATNTGKTTTSEINRRKR